MMFTFWSINKSFVQNYLSNIGGIVSEIVLASKISNGKKNYLCQKRASVLFLIPMPTVLNFHIFPSFFLQFFSSP